MKVRNAPTISQPASSFNSASITAALNNIQGVTTDVSYLSAQVTTLGTPSISNVANSATNPSVNKVTTTCPNGFVPTLSPSSSSLVTCTAAAGIGDQNQLTQTTTNTPATTQQVTTTTPSYTAAVPVAPASTAPAAPTNVGLSADDILTEQVQLNSQITTLRMALQGSLSDQYLVKEGKVVSSRQQTTLGFNISLDPPRRYKHAVAEVRVWVYQAKPDDELSVVNLLPAAKTYNVAKITSNQKAFGAGVVIDPVNIGVAGGKTKNRLYLAKDTDTVALQYYPNRRDSSDPVAVSGKWPMGAKLVDRSVQERYIADPVSVITAWQHISNACADDPAPEVMPDANEKQDQQDHSWGVPLVFGWQFRPVLGAEYVQAGNRQVFAQIALPTGIGNQYSPYVFIQTRWRRYDEKNQVVGAVYDSSCSVYQEPEPIMVDSPLKVRRVYIDDMGGGIVKVKASGRFYQQGFSVLNGPSQLGPAMFDGENIQFFANAAGLLQMNDLALLAENGRATDLGESPAKSACGITTASMVAVPRPDGNSWVEAQITTGADFQTATDSLPHPLFLIGSQVYGLHETPFIDALPDAACEQLSTGGLSPQPNGTRCTYHFLASTQALRSAQAFTVRDLSWAHFGKDGPIALDPAFTGLTSLAPATDASADDAAPAPVKKGGSVATPKEKAGTKTAAAPLYMVAGTDFDRVQNFGCSTVSCLEVYGSFNRIPLASDNFQHFSATTAALSLATPAAKPVFGFKGNSCSPCKVKITSGTSGAKIFYTFDAAGVASDPTKQGRKYSAPVAVVAGQTLRAFARAPGSTPSEIAILTVRPDGTIDSVPDVQMPDDGGAGSASSYKTFRFIWHASVGGQKVE